MSLVFRGGKWIQIAPPSDPLWSRQDQLAYAAAAATMGEVRAEALVHTRLHPGLGYHWSRGNNITPQSTKKKTSV